ncbi:ribonuclease toxin immunity protein CdiI [Priestia koreensis]|uniref:ribonuclease toxin immunity protein CdiI n=1 Tax=Priestia koreensis TaxID=284581 RepID=UPI001F57B0B8|nr:ribonuclease toxin immunity protein CdiI [Priestia koreensis]UNL83218.1 hypothetical protein IE339_13580 [Priestia koreensis]
MEDKNKKLVNYYFQVLGDYRFLKALEKLSGGEGYGIEHVWSVFAEDYEEWEEDYFGDEGIAFYFDYPAVEEDEEVIIDYETLFIYLKEITGAYIARHPENESEIGKYMNKIKERYQIKK